MTNTLIVQAPKPLLCEDCYHEKSPDNSRALLTDWVVSVDD
ncbi:hypothetical protein CEV32_3208 [Brucella rhizosphaerae]|uniref:Uncharacterized protein n=1 Tax=Brucella rhizosphaerae TaxID=571254 RepID=A0A256FUN9_9HYPH|nr:hypothetical protein CEV32_3208 [Brucella rhizosphaerae]